MAQWITIEEALELVKSNDTIVTGLGAAEARHFLSNLHTIAHRVDRVSVTNCLPMSAFPFLEEQYKDAFEVEIGRASCRERV